MKRFIPQISVCVIIIFALTSILQYHHHDCDGNIYIHLTSLDDFVIGSSKHAVFEHCDHNHICYGHENHSDNDEEHICSMHLGDYKISDYNVLCQENDPIIISWDINEIKFRNLILPVSTIYVKSLDKYISDFIISCSSLRAPPFK